jgi:hypothetical protein
VLPPQPNPWDAFFLNTDAYKVDPGYLAHKEEEAASYYQFADPKSGAQTDIMTWMRENIMSPLEAEMARLASKYPDGCSRMGYLNTMITGIKAAIETNKANLKQEAEQPAGVNNFLNTIVPPLLNDNQYPDMHKDWFHRVAGGLLNALLVLTPVIGWIGAFIKKQTTGTWFCSWNGKTSDTVEEAREKAVSMRPPPGGA